MENHVPLSDPEGRGYPASARQRDKERIETEYLDNKFI